VLAAYEEGKKSGKALFPSVVKMIDAPIVLRAHQTLEMAETERWCGEVSKRRPLFRRRSAPAALRME
jgi:hypothetical protein